MNRSKLSQAAWYTVIFPPPWEFKGSIVNNEGLLQWKTENESTTLAFVIERSSDGRDYKPIGSVAASNLPGAHFFEYTDAKIVSIGVPVLYYRLKQSDIDGQYTYSNIVTLAINSNRNYITLYPNPVKNKINLTISTSQQENLQWLLVDNTGRTIKIGMHDLSRGSTAVTMDVSELSAGIYFLQLKGEALKEVFKIIKQDAGNAALPWFMSSRTIALETIRCPWKNSIPAK